MYLPLHLFQMSLEVGSGGSRHRINQSRKILGFILVVFVFIVSQLRHNRNFMTANLVEVRDKTPLNGTAMHTHDMVNNGFRDEVVTGVNGKEDNNIIPAIDSDQSNLGEENFTESIWPKLKEKICPLGTPKISLGTLLFEQGRIEFGLDANATASKNPEIALKNRKRTSSFFYDGGFGFSMFLDGIDPNNNVFYASIWKCANDQIHSYLERLFNRRADGNVRDTSRLDDFANDTYLESLKIRDLKILFREELERQSGDDNNEGNAFFTFNHTGRTKPCVFTVLRDPISHFLSGFNEVEYRLIEEHDDALHQIKGRSNELAPYTRIPYNESDNKREERFQTFVKNLLMEHPSFSAFDYYKHFASMSRILPTLSRFNLLPKLDANEEHPAALSTWFLPTLENLTDTFPAFLADRCPSLAYNYQRRHERVSLESEISNFDKTQPRGNASLPPMKRRGMHESSNDGYGTYKAAKDVWKKGGPAARALCVLHIFDYACFDLDIPPLCRDVYARNQFFERILSEA